MNAIELLKKDHDRVRELFGSYEKAGDQAQEQKRATADKIFHELEAHTQIEEEIFYPAAKQAFPEEDQHLVAEAYEEHAVAKSLIADMKGMSAGTEDHDAKMKVLKENVEHHIEEEQGEMFPMARQNMGGDHLNQLGVRMENRKRQLAESQQPLGSSLVKMVSRAFDSLTGTPSKPPRKAAPRRAAAQQKAAARKRATKSSGAAKGTARRKKTGTTGGKRRSSSAGLRAARSTSRKATALAKRKGAAARKSLRTRATKVKRARGRAAKTGRRRSASR